MREVRYKAAVLPDEEAAACHQCGQCVSVCPSFRQGGIDPREVVMLFRLGRADPSDPVLWLCTMCNSCEERCELQAAPAELIMSLRSRAAAEGNVPKAFKEEARLFQRTGLSFPSTGLTKKLRKEMGLEELTMDQHTVDELGVIIRSTKLGGLDLD